MRKYLPGVALWVVGLTISGCTALGLTPPNLASDCAAQAGVIQQATSQIRILSGPARAAIDGQIALSSGYCSGTLPADQTAASKAVEAATASIAATLAASAIK